MSRKPIETIRVGNDVQVIVLTIRENEVRVGTMAPLDVSVDRDEVAERNRRERGELARWRLTFRLLSFIVAWAFFLTRSEWGARVVTAEIG